MKIRIISKSSPIYPKELLSLKEPPEILFTLGNISLLESFPIGIVGARVCSKESIMMTRQLVNDLSNSNISIISGMAYGIDQVVHESCIENNVKTIAVIGGGFNSVKSRKIYSKIIENDGLILSEYFPDIPAYKFNFPRRNELIVLLSKAIVAVEAHLNSGTMITANAALKQDVPLYTFPGGIYDERYLGNNLLLTKGAKCINNSADLIKSLKSIYPNNKLMLKRKENISTKIPEKYKDLYSILNKSPQSINEIARKLNLSINDVQSRLTLMELEDLVCKIQNNSYIKK